MSSTGSGDDKPSNLWSVLPSFDPSVDDAKEYADKVQFLEGICPSRDRPMLAPRLAMLCKGTAWAQVRMIPAEKLTDPDTGVRTLLNALSTWQETAEMQTYEKFEKAMYRVTQKQDESLVSYVNRLAVAFTDLGEDTTISSLKAFVLLRQSVLSGEDKKKILTMTGGVMDVQRVETSMRALSTKILLGPGDATKRKVYPLNHVDDENIEETAHVALPDEEPDEEAVLQQLVEDGDEHAMFVSEFEEQIIDVIQDSPDLAMAFSTYQEARAKIKEKIRSRGFWPLKGRSKGKGKGKSKFASFGGRKRQSLAERIAASHCRICGQKGHWKQECPQRLTSTAEANLATALKHSGKQVEEFAQSTPLDEASEFVSEVPPWPETWQAETSAASWWSLVTSTDFGMEDQGSIQDTFNYTTVPSLEFQRHFGGFTFFLMDVTEHEFEACYMTEADRWSCQRLGLRQGLSVAFSALKSSPRRDPTEVERFKSPVETPGHGIVDTGASKTVIGQHRVQPLLETLPLGVRQRVQWRTSATVFRFGNNDTLKSVGALFIPFGRSWFRIEVVSGKTPFLISNACLRALSASLCTAENCLRIPAWNAQIQLTCNSKGLFLLELGDLIALAEQHSLEVEVVSFMDSVSRSSDAAKVVQSVSPLRQCAWPSVERLPSNPSGLHGYSSSTAAGGLHGQSGVCHRDGALGPGVEPPGGPLSASSPAPDAAVQASRGVQPSDVGPTEVSGGQAQEPDVRGSVPDRGCLLRVDGQSQTLDVALVQEFSELRQCPSSDRGEPLGLRGSGTRADSRPPSGGDGPGELGAGGFLASGREAKSDGQEGGCGHGRDEGQANAAGVECRREAREDDKARSVAEGDREAPAGTGVRETNFSSEASSDPTVSNLCSVESILTSLDEVVWKLRQEFTCLNMGHDEGSKGMSESFWGLDLLEVYCEPGSRLTEHALKLGLTARRFTFQDGNLATPTGQQRLWDIIEKERPRAIWVAPECKHWGSFSRFNEMRGPTTAAKIQQGRLEQRPHLQLCNQLFCHQRGLGGHFHMEQPQGSVLIQQPEVFDIYAGTLCTTFDMCEVGKLMSPQTKRLLAGNSFLRKRTTVYTTSRLFHQSFDFRYCKGLHEHQPIVGRVRYLNQWISLSEFAARYSAGFARNVASYLWASRSSRERPLEWNELCVDPADSQADAWVGEVFRRRRKLESVQDARLGSGKRTRLLAKGPPHDSEARPLGPEWRTIFDRLDSVVPRVGKRLLSEGSSEFDLIQAQVPELKLRRIETCRGTDRFQVPAKGTSSQELPLRFTVIRHRETGQPEALGGPEAWTTLSKQRQVRRGRPARLCVTMFGSRSFSGGSSAAPGQADSDALRPTSDSDSQAVDDVEEPIHGHPPANVARHGPGFLNASADDRATIRRVHHNLGHPTAAQLVKFLKERHAENRLLQAALDFQCDACAESRTGFAAPRPAVIHEDVGFNKIVGMDAAFWTSKSGHRFAFLHVIDEGTLFHVGATLDPGDSSTSALIRMFRWTWLSWAGPPQVIYLDPASEFASDMWRTFAQSNDIQIKMSARDSHWQVGRAEIHGAIVKKMLDRMDLEAAITTPELFEEALIHAFNTKNSLSRVKGFSPEQAVLGVAPRLPGSIVSCAPLSSHMLAEGDDPEGQAFQRSLELRTSARKAFIEADNSSAFRRALLRRSRPIRGPFEPGDLVLYWKRVGANLRRDRGRWHGPARVLMLDGRHVIWLSHAGKLIRASPEQLRPASLREWKIARDAGVVEGPSGQWKQQLQAGILLELGDEVSEESPQPDVEPPEYEPSVGHSGEEPEREVSAGSDKPLDVPMDGSSVPIPDDSDGDLLDQPSVSKDVSEDEALFGDDIECETGDGAAVMWELDITPPGMIAGFFGESADECALTASDARKKKVEVRMSDLSGPDQLRMAIAKHKEIGAWLHHKTVRKVAKGRIPEHAIMRCRWILSWKPIDPSPENPDGHKAKARLVVIGFEDPDLGTVKNDSPTLTKDGRQMVLQAVSSHHWPLISFDVSTAFLHGEGDGRLLGIHAPPEMSEGLNMSDRDQCELLGGAYGRVDAPYLWFVKFRDTLLAHGFKQCPLDSCVFSLTSLDQAGKIQRHGALGVHVDDGIGGGDQKFRDTLNEVQKVFKFGSWEEKTFTFTGIRFHQWDDGSIEYDQVKYIEGIRAIEVSMVRRKTPEALVTEPERRELRSLVGALQYAAVHSRPDLAAKVGEVQSRVTKAQVQDLLTANRVLQEAKAHKVSLMTLPIAPEHVAFCAFSDASFLSNHKDSAHQGALIFATTPELLENQRSVVSPVAWISKKIHRVVRSTLGAESVALSGAVDRLLWLRILWMWLLDPRVSWQTPEEALKQTQKASLVTDCRSAFDLLTRTAIPQCEEYRTTIECLLIRERLKDNCTIRWVSSNAQLADCLTKSMDASTLRSCLASGKYKLFDENLVLQQRADRKQRVKWAKEATQACSLATHIEDYWDLTVPGKAIRVHVRARQRLFSPVGVMDSPGGLQSFGMERLTEFHQGSKKWTATDFWPGSRGNLPTPYSWTGRTIFSMRREGGV